MQVPQRKQCTLIEALHLVVLALPMLASAEFTDPRQTVDAHNQKRALHRVPALRWDDNLARFAESLVSNCKFKHSGGKYGENLHASSEGRASINDAVNAWYNEIKFYDFRNPAFSLQTSHFTAVVWKNTQRVGCAYATNCPGKWETVLACEYDSPGNVIGDFQNNVLSPGHAERSDKLQRTSTHHATDVDQQMRMENSTGDATVEENTDQREPANPELEGMNATTGGTKAEATPSLQAVKGYGQSAFPVQSRQVVNRRSYSSYSPYDCLLSATHNCRTRLASGDAQHLSQPVPLHHYLVHKHRSSNH
eukprot:jgi/Botrbrau1/22239/Bobra.0138s0001.1